MIDTVVLLLSPDSYSITDPDAFSPTARWIHSPLNKTRGMQSKQAASKKELRAGDYKPRLFLFHSINHRNASEILLKIEISLPKLFFGNNFNELQLKDFPAVINRLADILATMGVLVKSDVLAKSPVSTLHYAKNIPLTDGSTPYHYIKKIQESNVKLSLDVNRTDFRNDGHSYKWHCNSYEVVFYDKIKDLERAKKSNKRSVEKDSDLQLDIFNALQKRDKLEILRMEVRLNKRQKIKTLFKKLNIKTNLTLKALFKPAIAKAVLLHYLDELESKRSALLDYRATNDKALLAALLLSNLNLSVNKIMQMFGLKKALEVCTIRELRGMFAHKNSRSWYRFMADVNKVVLPSQQQNFRAIRECLSKFKPLKL